LISGASVSSSPFPAARAPPPPTARSSARCLELLFLDLLQVEQRVVRALRGADQLVELDLDRRGVAVLRVLDQNTIRKVMIVVLVLTTSCQVSLKPNSGPLSAHSTIASSRSEERRRPAARWRRGERGGCET
jgi:hypothetical protein